MMHGNFLADFERLYSANRKVSETLEKWNRWFFWNILHSSIKKLQAIVDQQAEDLRELFRCNFPKNPGEVYATPGLDCKKLLQLLKTYPELARDNKKSLESLLYYMRTTHKISLGIDKIPDISEFIPDEESEQD